MNKKILLLGVLLPFAANASFAEIGNSALESVVSKKAYQAAKSKDSEKKLTARLEEKAMEVLKKEHPQATEIFNAGLISDQFVVNADWANEGFQSYLFSVTEGDYINYYLVRIYYRSGWGQYTLNNFWLLSQVDASTALPKEVMVTKIKNLKKDLKKLSVNQNFLEFLFSQVDIHEVKSILNVQKGKAFKEEERNRNAYESYAEILLMDGSKKKLSFTWVPASATEDGALTFEQDQFTQRTPEIELDWLEYLEF